MRIETMGPLQVVITGGTDREGGGDGPVCVLMHGFGAPGDDLVPLWRQIAAPKGTRFVFPRAPLELGGLLPAGMAPPGDSRAWWMIDMQRLQIAMLTGRMREMADDVPAGLDEARAGVLAMLAALEPALGMRWDKLVLGGFSQGAMLAMDVALHLDRPPAALALLSGALIARGQWVPRMSALAGLPILQSHGRQDPILPFAGAEALRDALAEAGCQMTWVPFHGGHGIADAVLAALGDLLHDTLS